MAGPHTSDGALLSYISGEWTHLWLNTYTQYSMGEVWAECAQPSIIAFSPQDQLLGVGVWGWVLYVGGGVYVGVGVGVGVVYV